MKRKLTGLQLDPLRQEHQTGDPPNLALKADLSIALGGSSALKLPAAAWLLLHQIGLNISSEFRQTHMGLPCRVSGRKGVHEKSGYSAPDNSLHVCQTYTEKGVDSRDNDTVDGVW